MSWLLPLLLACALDADSYPRAYARAFCSSYARCDPEAYETYYGGLDHPRRSCLDEISAELEDYRDAHDCEVDPEAARDCISTLRGLDCEDWGGSATYEPCRAAWVCGEQ